jgi:hypothetical protein
MADASSVRKAATLPKTSTNVPTIAASSIRYSGDELQVATPTQWVPLGRVVLTAALPVSADGVDQYLFLADRAYQIVSVQEIHTTAGGSGAQVAVNKLTANAVAPSAGTNMLTAVVDLTTTVNTVQAGTLSATTANTKLAAGDRIALDFSGTITPLAGGILQIILKSI